MKKTNTTYMLGHREREQAVASIQYGTLEQYLEAQQQYVWLFQHNPCSIKFQDLADAIKEGRAIAIINSSHKKVACSITENNVRNQQIRAMGLPTCDTR
jgi:hypothetical protein